MSRLGGKPALPNIQAPTCPYCNTQAKLIHHERWSSWECENCDARVGVHRKDNSPLGTLANYELRQKRKEAHYYFDKLWQGKMRRDGCTKNVARTAGYKWLAGKLGVDKDDCHIAMFDLAVCGKVIDVCSAVIDRGVGSGR